jgi:hypothetical protein
MVTLAREDKKIAHPVSVALGEKGRKGKSNNDIFNALGKAKTRQLISYSSSNPAHFFRIKIS